MNFLLNFTLSIFLLFIALTSQAQVIEWDNSMRNLYSYNNIDYKFKEMESIFQTQPEVLPLYHYSVNTKNRARTLGYLSISAVPIGLIGIASSNPENCLICVTSGQVLGFLSLSFAAVSGFTAILVNHAANKKAKRAIAMFNQSAILDNSSSMKEWKLKVGSTSNGVGLTLLF